MKPLTESEGMGSEGGGGGGGGGAPPEAHGAEKNYFLDRL